MLQTNTASFFNAPFINYDTDSIERITVLGAKLTNPYLIPNITHAYHNLGIYNVPVVVTNLYVRFKPANIDQLALLDSTMEVLNLELFDTPVDYDITTEGDYYQDPTISPELITWQYAVVPPNFIFPAGIQNETLAQIHIPGDNYTAVETEAENLAGVGGTALLTGIVRPNDFRVCPEGYHWDYDDKLCAPNNCPAGYHWSGTGCVVDQTSNPAPAADAAIPAGNIRVHDTQLDIDPGVRKARVVAKRWFKIERVYTDNNGHFTCTKRFKHKVKIKVKFKNDAAQVRAFRGFMLWQMLYPVQRTLGIYSGDKSAIPTYTAAISGDVKTKGSRYFAAATVHNALQEYRDYAVQEGIALPPTGMKIMLSNKGNGSASTPMFAKRFFDGLVNELLFTYFMSNTMPVTGAAAAVLVVLKRQVDIIISYNVATAAFTSNFLKENAYHELTHAGQYNSLGNGWYSNFVSKEITEVIKTISNPGFRPYGNGTSSTTTPVIALGESWAYYMGNFLSDRTYGTLAVCQTEQTGGIEWCNTAGTGHPHIDVVENFNPNLASDPFRWIPQGLFQDLRDPANEIAGSGSPVVDIVAGYTNAQMFSAFQSNINTLQDYRIRLLQITTNPTSVFVTNLFTQYHY